MTPVGGFLPIIVGIGESTTLSWGVTVFAPRESGESIHDNTCVVNLSNGDILTPAAAELTVAAPNWTN